MGFLPPIPENYHERKRTAADADEQHVSCLSVLAAAIIAVVVAVMIGGIVLAVLWDAPPEPPAAVEKR